MYNLVQKYKKHLIIGYIFLLIFGFFYTRAVLNKKEYEAKEKGNEKKENEVKPTKVFLNVHTHNDIVRYSARLSNKDSVLTFIEYLRNKENFWYEKTAYTYGVELDYINRIKAPENYKWRIFLNDEDITFEINSKLLEDKAEYNLKLVPIHTLEH